MWGIVTNKPTRMTLQLLNCLELYCPFVVCGDTLRDRKPSPKPLLIASKLMNIDPINITYVGDAKRDIEAGRIYLIDTSKFHEGLSRQNHLYQFFLGVNLDAYDTLESICLD